MNIVCPRKALLSFRRLCRRNFPNETLGLLRGQRTIDGIEIKEIIVIDDVISTPDYVQPNDHRVIPKAKISALRKDQEFLGTIHSHCSTPECKACEHLSAQDIITALHDGELICGVVYVYKAGTRSDVNWYVPTLPPRIQYV